MPTRPIDDLIRTSPRWFTTLLLGVIPGVLAFFASQCAVKGLQGVLPVHPVPVELAGQNKAWFTQGSNAGRDWRYDVQLQRKDNHEVVTVSCPEDLFMELLTDGREKEEMIMMVSALGGEPLSLRFALSGTAPASPEAPPEQRSQTRSNKAMPLQALPHPWVALSTASLLLGLAVALGWPLPRAVSRRQRVGVNRVASRPLLYFIVLVSLALGWRAALWG